MCIYSLTCFQLRCFSMARWALWIVKAFAELQALVPCCILPCIVHRVYIVDIVYASYSEDRTRTQKNIQLQPLHRCKRMNAQSQAVGVAVTALPHFTTVKSHSIIHHPSFQIQKRLVTQLLISRCTGHVKS